MDMHTLQAMPVEFHKFKAAVTALAELIFKRRMFPPGHISVENASREAFIRLDVLLHKKPCLLFKIRGDFISYLNYRVDVGDRDNKAVNFMRERFSRMSVDEVEFCTGLSKNELLLFAAFLQGNTGESDKQGNEWLDIKNIKVRNTDSGEKRLRGRNNEFGGGPGREKRKNGIRLNNNGGGKMGRLISGVLMKMGKIGSRERQDSAGQLLKLVEREGRNSTPIMLLSSLREFDEYTFSHSVNVAVISTAIGRWLGFSEETVDDIGIAALMHDMGKIYIPGDILRKKGRLSPTEWLAIKKHPVHGYRILREEGVDYIACRVAYEHHMRYDLKGYPPPRSNADLHNYSHIVRIADSYDALTTNRPYRKQLDPFSAIKLMYRGKGGEFHPHFLEIFMNVLGNIPVGSIIQLISGEIAVVVNVNELQGELPTVRILKDSEGNPVKGDIIVDLNRRREETGNQSVIKGILDGFKENIDVGKYLHD